MVNVGGSNLVTISCADHSQYVAIALRNLYDSKRGTDFELNWEGKSTRAHRIILELFLATETLGCTAGQPHDELLGIKQEVTDGDGVDGNNVLEFLLEFLYKGEVTVPAEQLEDLLRASKKLEFRMLEDAVVQSRNTKAVEVDFKDSAVSGGPEKRSLRSCRAGLGKRTSNQNRVAQVAAEEIDVQSLCVQDMILVPQSETTLACKDPDSNANNRNSNAEQLHRPRKMMKANSGEVPVVSHPQNDPIEDDSSSTTDGASNLEVASSGASKLFKCPHCEFETSSNRNLRLHLVATHGINTRGEPAPKHKCPHCKFEATAYMKYHYHLSVIHGVTVKGTPAPNYKCAHCEFETSSNSTFRYHNMSAHGKTIHGEPAPRYQCPDCDYSTAIISILKKHHKLTHVKARPYTCEHCTYAGKMKHHLARHLTAVHGVDDSRFTCTICSERYYSLGGLEHHMREHTDEQP